MAFMGSIYDYCLITITSPRTTSQKTAVMVFTWILVPIISSTIISSGTTQTKPMTNHPTIFGITAIQSEVTIGAILMSRARELMIIIRARTRMKEAAMG